MASSSVSLWGQFIDDHNEPLGSSFPARVSTYASIDHLRKEIYKTLPRRYIAELSPNDLEIWKLSNPLLGNKDYNARLAKLQFPDSEDDETLDNEEVHLLNPLYEIQECWDSEPLEECVHLIVRAPRGHRNDRLDEINAFEAFYRRSWGQPLRDSLTKLPPYLDSELGNEEDPNGDVLPGDPYLMGLHKGFLVRAEYIRVFDKVKEVYDARNHEYLAVVTGQPGIGKTWWIQYAIRRCLGEKQPVIWYLGGKFVVFSADGVYMAGRVFGGDRWCFVDSTAADRLPDAIYDEFNGLFPIYVTAPKKERWEKLHQLRLPRLIIMNPWTRDELLKAGKLYGQTPEDILERFDNAGPIARHCLEFSSVEIAHFYFDRDCSIKVDTSRRLMEALFDHRGELRIDDTPHRFCVVRRSPDARSFAPFIVSPISAFVRHRLLTQIWEWEEKDRINMIEYLSREPAAGGICGLLFESHFHRRFAQAIATVASPMLSRNSRWYAAFGKSSGVTQQPLTLRISPWEWRIYDGSQNFVIEDNIYYVPGADTQAAIDSFILHNGHLYMFQFTSSKEHTVSNRLSDTLLQFSNRPVSENQHLIFVVPNNLTHFSCPHSNTGFLCDHVPYVVQLDVGLQ